MTTHSTLPPGTDINEFYLRYGKEETMKLLGGEYV